MAVKGTYYQEKLPELIEKLKSQTNKNMKIMVLDVTSGIGEEKFFNVLKGRRDGAVLTIETLTQIEKLEANPIKEEGYFFKTLPILIKNLKDMVDLNLDIVDVDIDEDFGAINDEEDEIVEKKLTEDKYHLVLKARKTASVDTEWALKKIDELENILNGGDNEVTKKKSWAKLMAEDEE